ncbi:MAG: hypothetical protein ACJ72N_13560 [Labedaea sp.]
MRGAGWRIAGIAAVAMLGASACGATAPTATEVTVSMTDFALQLSTSDLTPGAYTFVAKNDGYTRHAIEIAGNGLDATRTAELAPGGSERLSVTLADGTYQLYCPVTGHRQKGMSLELRVDGAAGGSTDSGGGGGGGGY